MLWLLLLVLAGLWGIVTQTTLLYLRPHTSTMNGLMTESTLALPLASPEAKVRRALFNSPSGFQTPLAVCGDWCLKPLSSGLFINCVLPLTWTAVYYFKLTRCSDWVWSNALKCGIHYANVMGLLSPCCFSLLQGRVRMEKVALHLMTSRRRSSGKKTSG